MTFPANTKIKTKAAEVFFSDQGYVRVNVCPSVQQTLADAKENMTAICQEFKIPLIVDLRLAKPVDPEVRRFYSGQVLVDHFTSMAIIIDLSAVGRMMVNIYLAVAKPAIPTKVFTDENEAVKWTIASKK